MIELIDPIETLESIRTFFWWAIGIWTVLGLIFFYFCGPRDDDHHNLSTT